MRPADKGIKKEFNKELASLAVQMIREASRQGAALPMMVFSKAIRKKIRELSGKKKGVRWLLYTLGNIR